MDFKDEESKFGDHHDVLELNEAHYCDLYKIRNNVYQLCEFDYHWLDIISFKIPSCHEEKEDKKNGRKKSLFNKKKSVEIQVEVDIAKDYQPFIYIKSKISDESSNDSWIGESNTRTILYLHDNLSDIGTVLGHCIDLSSQLECNVIIPELSGFGDYNKSIKSITDRKTIMKYWLNDAKNALGIWSKLSDGNFRNLVVYSKGMSTTIALELMKEYKFKNIVFEEAHSSLKTLKNKNISLSKCLYFQLKKNYL